MRKFFGVIYIANRYVQLLVIILIYLCQKNGNIDIHVFSKTLMSAFNLTLTI